MKYSELKKQNKEKEENQKILSPLSSLPKTDNSDRLQCVEELVKEKYQELECFYKDINDPDNIVPNREELRKSLNSLLLAEEKIKFNEMVSQYDKQISQYKKIIINLLEIFKTLIHIGD